MKVCIHSKKGERVRDDNWVMDEKGQLTILTDEELSLYEVDESGIAHSLYHRPKRKGKKSKRGG